MQEIKAEFQAIIPAGPGRDATVVFAEPTNGVYRAVTESYSVVGWGVTATDVVPLLAGFDRRRLAGIEDGTIVILMSRPGVTGLFDTRGCRWPSINDAAQFVVGQAEADTE